METSESAGDEPSFSVAVSQAEFEKMMMAATIDVLDWTRMGPESEFDIHLSFETTEDEREMPTRRPPEELSPAEAAFGHVRRSNSGDFDE